MKLREGLKSVLNWCKSISDTASLSYGKNITGRDIIDPASLALIEYTIAAHYIGSLEAADLIVLAGDLSMEGISVEVMMDCLKSLSRKE